MRRTGLLLSALILQGCSTIPEGDWSSETTVIREPLPSGVVARLGTLRFRHPRGDSAIVASPDGRLLATGGADAVIRIWDAATGIELRTILGLHTTDMDLLFHPDGKRLLSGGQHDGVRVWDLHSGKTLLGIEMKSGYFGGFALSPDGETLATGTRERIAWLNGTVEREQNGAFDVRLWNLGTGREIRKLYERVWDGVSKEESVGITSLGFTPDGRSLYAVGRHQPLRIWNVETGKELLSRPSPGDSNTLAQGSPDGRTLALAGADSNIRLLDLATGGLIRTLKGRAEWTTALRFSRSGKLLASAGDDKSVVLWDVASGLERKSLVGHAGWVTALTFSPDEKTLATGGWEDSIRFWDVATGRERARPSGHLGEVLAASFSADGSRIVSLGADRTIREWDGTTGKELTVRKTAEFPSGPAAVSLTAQRAAIADEHSRHERREPAVPLLLLDPRTGAKAGELPVSSSVHSLAFSPDGTLLASGEMDRVTLWDLATMKESQQLRTGRGFTTGLAFAPDGKSLVVGRALSISYRGGGGSQIGSEKTFGVALWDIATEKSIRTLFEQPPKEPPHAGLARGATAAAYSGDGRTIAIADDEKHIGLWDVPTGRKLSTLKGHRASIGCLAFSPDSRRLVSGSSDGTMLIWSVDLH